MGREHSALQQSMFGTVFPRSCTVTFKRHLKLHFYTLALVCVDLSPLLTRVRHIVSSA